MKDLKPPQDCADMVELRQAIDVVDRELVALLTIRAGYIDRAIEIKRGNGLPARIPTRVEDVVTKVKAEATETGLDADLVEALWRRLIDWSIAREAMVIDPE
ncbi:chorismate mutase [Aestuariibius sp. HNIBRBA575]|uniref:chorismate mutase n=1 Tax=Aestuariibius sp. HNIBRBA575 TaxID=3233343 RepID=UPI0034A3967E